MVVEVALQEMSHLSSSPPSLRTMFRSENTVPNTNFESSSVARIVWPVPAGPGWAGPSAFREDFPMIDAGRGSQRRL